MNKLQTITRLLLKDNTSDYKKNLYKIPFTNIYFLVIFVKFCAVSYLLLFEIYIPQAGYF